MGKRLGSRAKSVGAALAGLMCAALGWVSAQGDGASEALKTSCMVSPSADCVILLATTEGSEKALGSNRTVLKSFVHARRADLATKYAGKAARQEWDENLVQYESAVRQLIDLMEEARRNGASIEETRMKVLAIADVMPISLRFWLYMKAINGMVEGVPGNILPVSKVNPRRWAGKYGKNIDTLVELWQYSSNNTLAIQIFLKSMLILDRKEDARQALIKARTKLTPGSHSEYCAFGDYWLALDEPEEAVALIKGQPCYSLRGKIAVYYAKHGNVHAAIGLVNEVLAEFTEEQWKNVEVGPIYAPSEALITLQALTKALKLSGANDEARGLIERWIAYRRVNPGVGYLRGAGGIARLYMAAGDLDEAARVLEGWLTGKRYREDQSVISDFLRMGKIERIAELFKEGGEPLPLATAMYLYRDAIEAGKGPETLAFLEGLPGLKEAYRLHYVDLFDSMENGDDEKTIKLVRLLLDEEKRHAGASSRGHSYMQLLRCAVAMEQKDLAAESLRLLLAEFFQEMKKEPSQEKERIQFAMTQILVEAAAVYAQLPQ